MSKKTFSMYGTAVSADHREHVVTIVGLYEQGKRTVEECSDPFKLNGEVIKLISCKSNLHRELKYGISICHPEDDFVEEIGIRKAMKRAKKNPLGKLTTDMRTTLCEDQCKLILFGELQHVIKNIDHYIEKY